MNISYVDGLEPTKNGFGYMHAKSFIMDEFVAFAKTSKNAVLDIGSAYGIATIRCLNKGSKVIACDICEDHLKILLQRISPNRQKNLKTIVGRFPNQINFENKTIGAVLISHVLSFLEGYEIENGMKKIYNWLDDSGIIFILNYTPYHKTLEKFIPVYEQRILNKEEWPGLIEDKRKFSNNDVLLDQVPNRVNLMDIEILKKVAIKSGFRIEMLKYIGGADQGVPAAFCLNEMEWVGMIASK